MNEMYDVKIKCANCGTLNALKIAKKTSFVNHVISNKTTCRYCECKLKRK